jgi:flagellar L-ring protein precursor FlgH
MRNPVAGLFALCLFLLAGCQAAKLDIGREPHLTPVGSGLVVERAPVVQDAPARSPPLRTGSLWHETSAAMFRDPRASNAGDIVTVKIAIKDKASLDIASTRSRDARNALSSQLDYAINVPGFPRKGDASAGVSTSGATSTEGKGVTARSETIELLVAAVVTEVLPNGNLVITGSQEVRVNFEVRVLQVAGIIRPRDVSTDNTIAYDKIAEARISYGGRGRISEIQQPGFLQQIFDILAPF